MSDDRHRPPGAESRQLAGEKLPPHPCDDPRKIADALLDRRIAEEKAHYERGFPVAGHDFCREHEERERER